MIAGTAPQKRTVHAVLIDAVNRKVEDVQIEPTLAEYYRLIDCDCVAIGESFPNGDVLFVDDNGLLKSPKHFFKLTANGQAFAGNGLILGEEVEDDSDEGFYIADAKIKADYLGAFWHTIGEN